MGKKVGGKVGRHPSLVEQPHGGAIYQGPGNPPGSGRPPSAVKAALRESFADRIPLLEGIADGISAIRLVGTCEECGHASTEPLEFDELKAALKQAPTPGERIRAMEAMGKFSDLDDGKLPESGLLRELAQAVQDELDDPEALERIEERWLESLSRRFG